MAVTRIKNNQITDSTINAAAKLQDYSITSNKIANSLTYGSDLTISGNLTVSGSTTTVDTVNTTIKDSVLLLADQQTAGTPALDIGIVGYRGSQNSSFLGWKESATEFVAALSTTSPSNTTVTVTSYANFHANDIRANGNIRIDGTTSLTGNVIGNVVATGNVSVVGNIDGGNIRTAGLVSVTGNVTVGNLINNGLSTTTGNITGGNILTGGLISATATITGGNLATGGTASAAGNVTGGNLLTGGLISATGNISSGANLIVSGYETVTGNITGGNLLTGGLISATGNVTSGNLNSTNLSLTGNVVSPLNVTGNITTGNLINNGLSTTTGNITGGNLLTGGLISATATITGGNLATGGTASAAGNVTGGNLLTGGLISATGNATVGNLATATITANATISATGNITGGNLITSGALSANSLVLSKDLTVGGNLAVNGTLTYLNTTNSYIEDAVIEIGAGANGASLVANDGYNRGFKMRYYDTADKFGFLGLQNNYTTFTFLTAATDSANTFSGTAANLSFGNASASGIISATGNITGGNLNASGLSLSGNVVSALNVTGNITGGNLRAVANANVGNLSVIGFASMQGNAEVDGVLLVQNSATITQTLSVTGNITGGNLATATITANATISATGNITGGNVLTGGLISATATITGGNLATGGTASAAGNITGGNVLTGGLVSATGNVTGGNLITANLVQGTTLSATGNVTGGNLITGGLVSATANITGGNLLTGGLISATGNITGGNITTAGRANLGNVVISGNAITLNAAGGTLAVNQAAANINFGVSGGNANVLFVNATTNQVTISPNANTTQTTNAALAINATNSILVPVGNSGQRPGTGVPGMVRYNTDLGYLEYYNASTWQIAGASFTTIQSEIKNGDGSTVAFTINSGYTTAAVFVSINGVVQLPVTAYSVSGTTLTFTEAPAVGDVIEIRELVTTSTISSLQNGNGSISVSSLDAGYIQTVGNIIPGGNGIYSLGNSNNRFSNLFVSGNTVTIGNIVMKDSGSGTVAFYQADGVTAATLSGNNVDTTKSANGTAVVQTYNNANVTISAGGVSNVIVANSGGVNITGNLQVSGNITATSQQILTVTDPLLYLAATTTYPYNYTVGFYSHFTGGGGNTYQHTGLVRDYNDNVWKLFSNVAEPSGNTVSFTNAVYDTLLVGGLNTGGAVSATGNITGGNIITGGSMTITGASQAASYSATGNVTGGNITTAGIITVNSGGAATAIVNGGANGSGNIGSSSTYFNTVFAKSTSAQYADLAEIYEADAEYTPGTVLVFGGDKEVTLATADSTPRIAGVVSTNPSYVMNSALEAEFTATVALTGRVPCKVKGSVAKGDMMVSAGDGFARAEENPRVGSVIGKALENFDGEEGVIEVVVGRL